jgi:hypothetical protein
MATYQLMSNTTVTGDSPNDNITPLQISGPCTRCSFTLNLAGPISGYCGVTVLASLDGAVYEPFLTMAIEAGAPNTLMQDTRVNAPYTWWDAQLNYIVPGGNSANLTMTV